MRAGIDTGNVLPFEDDDELQTNQSSLLFTQADHAEMRIAAENAAISNYNEKLSKMRIGMLIKSDSQKRLIHLSKKIA